MKKVKIMIAASCLLSLNVFSQMDNNRYLDRGNGITSQQPAQNSEPSKEEIEKRREENLDNLMERLTADLTLDALQVVAIRQLYADNIKKQGVIMKKEESPESKSAAMKSLSQSTEAKVVALLNPQQKEKYEAIKNDAYSGKKKPKEKTKKKSKDKKE